MRGFIVLCFAAVAVAAPQGYNYPAAGGSHGGAGGFGGIGGGAGGLVGVGGGGSTGFFQGAGSSSGSSFVSQGGAGGFSGHHAQPIVSKRFYIHSAPEDNEEDFKERHITVGVPRKNYNVVFIKSPHRANHRASIKISPAVNEEKTVIYVLNKKSDQSDIHAEVIDNVAPTSKPEVFFIKYKTNEEAQHAQQQIQAQYDSLGGSSQVSDEGVAPVTSVIGSLGGGAGVGGDAGNGGAHGGSIGGGIVSGIGGGIGSGAGVGSFSGSGFGVSGGSSGSLSTSNAYLPPSH